MFRIHSYHHGQRHLHLCNSLGGSQHLLVLNDVQVRRNPWVSHRFALTNGNLVPFHSAAFSTLLSQPGHVCPD